jgi:NAD(P)-dependent dehydrogenase (short-subunit alcohol dehydrogenase family)
LQGSAKLGHFFSVANSDVQSRVNMFEMPLVAFKNGIDTSILGKVMPKDAVEKTYAQMAEANPMKRMGNAEEIAKAVIFLAFEATYTTGAELPVDGGVSQL